MDDTEKDKIVELEGTEHSLYMDKAGSLLYNTVCLFPTKGESGLKYSTLMICVTIGKIEKPIDYYAKIIKTPQKHKVEESAIIVQGIKKKRENLISPKDKVATVQPQIKKKSIKKPMPKK